MVVESANRSSFSPMLRCQAKFCRGGILTALLALEKFEGQSRAFSATNLLRTFAKFVGIAECCCYRVSISKHHQINYKGVSQTSNLGFVGAGIQLAPNMARILDRLGVWQDIEKEAVDLKDTSIRRMWPLNQKVHLPKLTMSRGVYRRRKGPRFVVSIQKRTYIACFMTRKVRKPGYARNFYLQESVKH